MISARRTPEEQPDTEPAQNYRGTYGFITD